MASNTPLPFVTPRTEDSEAFSICRKRLRSATLSASPRNSGALVKANNADITLTDIGRLDTAFNRRHLREAIVSIWGLRKGHEAVYLLWVCSMWIVGQQLHRIVYVRYRYEAFLLVSCFWEEISMIEISRILTSTWIVLSTSTS